MNSYKPGSQPSTMPSNKSPSQKSLNKVNTTKYKTTNIPSKTKPNVKSASNISLHAPIINKTGSHIAANHTTSTTQPTTTHSTSDTSRSTQNPLSSIDTNNKLNYALATANSNTPKREQAIVLLPVDGLLIKDYIIAIGQIISPSNIIFVSKISMGRVCVFLSSEQILSSLIEKSHSTLKINDHIIPIRRLLNPAKRIIISNVCPSIPNQSILDALSHINITPLSEINFLKAGIKEIGYEHILSFRRQIFIKHEDIPKLPGSLLINTNETNFRIFFTDDTITCYTCKSTGHTSMSCNKNTINSQNLSQPPNHQNIQTQLPISFEEQNPVLLENIQLPESPSLIEEFPKTHMDWTDETLSTPLTTSATTNPESMQHHITTNEDNSPTLLYTINQDENILHNSTQDQTKRSLSDTTSQISPSSPTPNQQPNKKKPKVISRSNSSTKLDEKNLGCILQSTEPFFSSTENNSSITYSQFIYILENFGNKQINIHSLCEDIDTNIPSVLETIEKIRPYIDDRSMKTKLTKLSNLLFKFLPLQDINQTS